MILLLLLGSFLVYFCAYTTMPVIDQATCPSWANCSTMLSAEAMGETLICKLTPSWASMAPVWTLLNRNTTNNFRKKLPWAWANQEMEEKCLKFQRLLINCSSSLKSSLANPRAPRYPLPNKANAKLENPVLAPTGIKTLPNWGSRVSAQIHHVGGVCGA